MANVPLIQISIRGGDVAIINGTVYAALAPPPGATTWIATAAANGTIQFADQASGLVMGAPDTDIGTQATATPPRVAVPVTSWIVTQYSDDDNATRITDPTNLTSGYYSIQEPSTGEFLYRNRIEDYSLRPKMVALQPDGEQPLIIRVVG